MHEGFMPKRISHITANVTEELIYSPPVMLYNSYEVLYNCYAIENNAIYNAILLISELSVYAATRQVKELGNPARFLSINPDGC